MRGKQAAWFSSQDAKNGLCGDRRQTPILAPKLFFRDSSGDPVGVVLEFSNARRFPIGKTFPGIRIQLAAVGGETWIPMHGAQMMYVVKR